MKVRRIGLIPAIVPLLLLISCGTEQAPQSQQQSYKDTKSMVLDVLKTEEAAQAIQEASTKSKDSTMKLLATGEGQQIQLAVKDILTTEDHGVKMLEKTMSDPMFAGEFAKASQKSLKQIQKDLLKDPEYQKNLFEALDNPDYQKIVLASMKSQPYRQQMMEVIRESLQSPLFKAELIAMFQKAVKEEMKPKEEKTIISTESGGKSGGGGGGESGGSGGESGGESGGGSESGGGGGESGGDSGGGGGGGGGESGEDSSGSKSGESKEKKKK